MRLKTLRPSFLFLSLFIGGLFFIGCDKKEKESILISDESSEVIETLSNNVLVAQLSGLYAMSESMLQIAGILHGSPNSEGDLSTAKNVWVNTRENWKIAEGFPFGPGETKGLNVALDSWPVDRVALAAILVGNDELTVSFVEGQSDNLKGFHAIEFLLWGEDGNKKAIDFTPRELDYLVSVSEVFNKDAEDLYQSWHASHENYVANLLNAGESGSVYESKRAVLEDFAEGIVQLANEMADNKIGTPLSAEDHLAGESPYSDNTTRDLFDNIISIQLFYEGIWDDGLAVIVKSVDGGLDSRVRAEIEAAKAAIEAIPDSFNEAVGVGSPNRTTVVNAQTALLKLAGSLQEVKDLIADL
ncbi:MAG: imelysin family protein [Saprospiraceae bacterium]